MFSLCSYVVISFFIFTLLLAFLYKEEPSHTHSTMEDYNMRSVYKHTWRTASLPSMSKIYLYFNDVELTFYIMYYK